jgi:hypothetical protein
MGANTNPSRNKLKTPVPFAIGARAVLPMRIIVRQAAISYQLSAISLNPRDVPPHEADLESFEKLIAVS